MAGPAERFIEAPVFHRGWRDMPLVHPAGRKPSPHGQGEKILDKSKAPKGGREKSPSGGNDVICRVWIVRDAVTAQRFLNPEWRLVWHGAESA